MANSDWARESPKKQEQEQRWLYFQPVLGARREKDWEYWSSIWYRVNPCYLGPVCLNELSLFWRKPYTPKGNS